MKSLLNRPLWVLFLILAGFAFAQPVSAPSPLTGEDRAVIVETLRRYSTFQDLWSYEYARDAKETAYYAGLRDGLKMSAQFVELYNPARK